MRIGYGFAAIILGIQAALYIATDAFAQDQSEAYGYDHCVNPSIMRSGGATGEECIVSCRKMANLIADTSNAITLNSAFVIHFDNQARGFGECTGAATDIQRTLYKIEIANDADGIEDTRCMVWEGEMPVSFKDKIAGDVVDADRPIDVSACPAGTYDAMLITQSRFIRYSGETVFPHDPTAIVRTHSVGVTSVEDTVLASSSPGAIVEMHEVWDSVAHGTTGDYTGMANFADPDKPVLETFNGNVQGALDLGDARKFALQSVTVDDVPATASYMDFDELFFFTGGDESTRAGYYCEFDYMCARALPNDPTKMEWLLKEGEDDIMSGLPVTISEDTKLNIEFGYFAPRTGEEELGLNYVFYYVSPLQETRAVGARPGEDGLFIKVSTEAAGE